MKGNVAKVKGGELLGINLDLRTRNIDCENKDCEMRNAESELNSKEKFL